MNGKITRNTRPAGIGTGYLSLMMIFVMLCLTALAALSLSAAENGRKFSRKSADYNSEYYAADLAAKRTLAEVDGIVRNYGSYDDFMLLAELENLENIGYAQTPGGLTINWDTPINERQNIRCEVEFRGGSFEVTSWRTVSSSEPEDTPLDVWIGE